MTQRRMTNGARWRAWLRQRPLLADSLLALVLFAVHLAAWAATLPALQPFSFAEAVSLTAAEMAAVAIRRRWLWVAVVVATVAALGSSLAGVGGGGLGFLVVAYTVAAYQPLRPALLATLVLWLPSLVLGLTGARAPAEAEVPQPFLLAFDLLLALVLFFVGRLVRTRRAYVAALEERARAAESNQRVLAEQAVAEERRRIARELHDLVAHHIAVMSVLATGARRSSDRDPATAHQALVTIEHTGRTVLREMRRLLHVLRTDAEPAGELAPPPGLAGIEVLVEQVRDAGLPVTLQVEGDPGLLDPGLALTVYRVVQEALTNVLKHAGPANAQVRIRSDSVAGALAVEVFDTGRGPRPEAEQGVGHGLVSMRERIAVYGGTLRTGPRPGGGFRVYATIPAADQPAADQPGADQLAAPEPEPR